VTVPGLVRKLRLDVTPLRTSRDFRLVFSAGIVSYLGSMITYVALPFQVKELTDSYVAVGALGLVELVPLIVFGLWGGALADAIDRRRMVVLTELGLGVTSVVLLVNALVSSPQLWVIYVVAALVASLDALQRPSLDSLIPRVVAHDQLTAAGALTSLRWQFGQIVGPAVGGLLVAWVGVGFAYGVDVATFVVSVALLWRLRPALAAEDADRVSIGSIVEGMRYAWSRKDLLGTYAVDLTAMVFAFPYAVFPFVADDLGAPWSLGLLYTAPTVGALLATITSGWTNHVHQHGRAIIWAALGWGAAITLFGLAPGVWWALLALTFAGCFDMVSGLFRGLMWNQTIPDEVRGRMAGIELLSYSVGPTLGQVRVSVAAQRYGLRQALVSGGLLCVAGVGLLAFTLPSLWRYDVQTDENALAQKKIRAERSERDGSPD
jgi:MFS family permease